MPFRSILRSSIRRLWPKKSSAFCFRSFYGWECVYTFADSFSWVLLGRVLQGLGSGGCFTLGTAIIFDVFRQEKALHAVNLTGTIIPLVMAGAPMLGGYLNESYGFRSNFLIIAIFALLSLVTIVFFFQESLPEEKRSKFQWSTIAHEFKTVLSNKSFWQLSLAISLMFSAYFIFVTNSALIYRNEFLVSKEDLPKYQAALLCFVWKS